MGQDPRFGTRISEQIWDLKYRFRADGEPVDRTLDDTLWRVTRAVAAAEKGGKRRREHWAARFYEAMSGLEFLPAGRILAGAGTGREVTLFNCFVLGRIDDDLGAIFSAVKEAAITMQQGGGIGHDFSTLRPRGALVRGIGADASGPVAFMDIWDAMCRSIKSAGARRGAMMATLRCDHPDIEAFIDVKADPLRLRNFNLSVLVTDAFLAAVRSGGPWNLVFDGKVYRTLPARELWDRLMRATYDYAEPGVIFIDRVNQLNNLQYCEEIHCTNPCGEQPLPPYGACLLGSVNLARLVERPFTGEARLDRARLESRVHTAVRFLDDAIDVSNYPLDAQRREAQAKRRIGLGVTGLANALILCGVRYGSLEAQRLAGGWMEAVQNAAYAASAALAAEKGVFPLYDAAKMLARPNIEALAPEVREAVRAHGLRNGCLTTIAPTGTISLLAGNVSSGVEPVFDFSYRRRVLTNGDATDDEVVEDYAHALFRREFGPTRDLTPAFVRTADLTPREHLDMQAAVQRHVDSAISKTINCPADLPFEAFKGVYLDAHALGLKGCTTYRPNAVTGAVLVSVSAPPPATPTDAAATSAAPRTSARAPSSLPLPPASSSPPVPSRSAGVVYMAPPLERDHVLAGYTYKLKWPASDHAIYVTINDIERDGRRRPFEIFINTRNLEHYAWTVALTRMISAVFRRGGDVSFVADELKAVFDPQGGHWVSGRYVPSLLAAIGEVIERHFVETGFMQPGTSGVVEPARTAATGSVDGPGGSTGSSPTGSGTIAGSANTSGRFASPPPPRICPRCSSPDYVREEGCWLCRACGFSRCG